jgi:hypothetical protein
MKANEFLHKKDVAYMNRLSTPLDFDRIVSLMEEYAALRIHDVVGRSEQLLAYTEWLKKEGLLNATVSKLIVKKYQSK